MTKNSGVHSVKFENATTETVTFVLELRSGRQSAFTLIQSASYSVDVPVQPLTHEQYRLVVGGDSNGPSTNEFVSTDELPGLDKVVVTQKESSGNNFVLQKHPRKTTKPWWSWSRNKGVPSNRPDV